VVKEGLLNIDILLHEQRYMYVFRTALHWAAKRNHSAVVHYLIESGADKTLKNDSGKTPVDLATERSTLLALGAALDTENGCAGKLVASQPDTIN
jgi:ankyrin repeat protein